MPLYENGPNCIINDGNVQPNTILDTGINAAAVGQLWGVDVNSGYQGMYLVGKGTILLVAADSHLSLIKDTANKINIYFESGALKIQNKLGSTRYLYVKFEGLI